MSAIGPRELVKLAALADLARAAQTIYGLTERFAAARSASDEDTYAQQLKRRYGRFKRALTAAGFDQVAQMAGAMESAAKRGGSQRVKARALREGIGSIRFMLDTEERLIRKPSVAGEGEEEGEDEGKKESTEDKPEILF